MAKFPPDSFLNLLQRSELFGSDRIEVLIGQMQESGVDVQDSSAISEWMVSSNHLTEWQAGKLQQGKHKGFRLGKYRLRDMLGKGGMSSVYLAEHTLMRRECAIKVLPIKKVKDSSYLARFHREAQAVAALDHPNIVRAYDIDHEKDKGQEIHFLVMEYVKGRNLHEMIKDNGPLSYEAGAEFCRQAALGLDHAHQAGLVHRDVKPGNLLLDETGTVKILDLGLARFVEVAGVSEASLTVAHEQKVLGTPDYLSPEQALDSHMVDSRADIYSLGCSMYFALTGQPPFNEGSIAQRLMWHQMKEPDEMSKVRPGIPDSLSAIVRKMMAKKPEDRYPAMADVASMLLGWLTANASREWQLEHADVLSSSSPAPTAQPVVPVAATVSTAVPTGLEILPVAPVAAPVVTEARPVAPANPPVADVSHGSTPTGDVRSAETVEVQPPVNFPEDSPADSVFGTEETADADGSEETLPSEGVLLVPRTEEESGTAVLTGAELAGAESLEIVASEGTELVPASPTQTEEPVPGFQLDVRPPVVIEPEENVSNEVPFLPSVPVAVPLDPVSRETDGTDCLQEPPAAPASGSGLPATAGDGTAVSFADSDVATRSPVQALPGSPDPLLGVPALTGASPQDSGLVPDTSLPVSGGTQFDAPASSIVVDDRLDSGSVSVSSTPRSRQKKSLPVGLIAGVLVALAGAGGFFWWQSRDPGGDPAGGQTQTQDGGNGQNQTGSGASGQGGITATGPEFLGYQIQVGPQGDFSTISEMFVYLRAARPSYRSIRGRVIRIDVAGGHYPESIAIDNADGDYPDGIQLIADQESPAVLDPTGNRPVVELADLEFFQLEGFQIEADGRDSAIVLRGNLDRCSLNRIHVSGYSSAGIRSEGARGTVGDELSLSGITFNPSSGDAVGIEFTGQEASRIQIDRCRFHGPQKAGIVFEQGATSVNIRGSLIERAEVGIILGGKGVNWRNFSIFNNTLYDCSQAGIRMAAAPSSQSFEIGIHRNLFSKMGGAEVVVVDGYDLQEFQRVTSSGTGGLRFNWSDRRETANQTTEWEVVLQPQQRVADFEFVSTDVGSQGFLSPTIAFDGFQADTSDPEFRNPGALNSK